MQADEHQHFTPANPCQCPSKQRLHYQRRPHYQGWRNNWLHHFLSPKAHRLQIYNGQDGKDGQDGKPGEDGKDGSTPIIGVKQDADGIYYWTLNGDWLTDDSGNKIKAEGRDGQDGEDGKPGQDGNDGQDGKPGEDGKDGITPQLKIEDGYWYISYNDGASWTQLGKATGDKGEQGEPGQAGGIFKDVEETDDSVIFTLNDKQHDYDSESNAIRKIGYHIQQYGTINVLPWENL